MVRPRGMMEAVIGRTVQIVNVLESIFPLQTALEMIPLPSMPVLYHLLAKHADKFDPPLYKKGCRYQGGNRRMLSEREILLARELYYTNEDLFANVGRRVRPHNIIESIIARCGG